MDEKKIQLVVDVVHIKRKGLRISSTSVYELNDFLGVAQKERRIKTPENEPTPDSFIVKLDMMKFRYIVTLEEMMGGTFGRTVAVTSVQQEGGMKCDVDCYFQIIFDTISINVRARGWKIIGCSHIDKETSTYLFGRNC